MNILSKNPQTCMSIAWLDQGKLEQLADFIVFYGR
jgi:hypothetical protein